jgi:hypothetical protein
LGRAQAEADELRSTANREATEIERHRDEIAAQFARIRSVLEGGLDGEGVLLSGLGGSSDTAPNGTYTD